MKKSQKQQIRFYLESGGKLTPMAALNFWGCFRLSARIYNINEDYYNEWLQDDFWEFNSQPEEIKTEIITTASGKRVAQYSLKIN